MVSSCSVVRGIYLSHSLGQNLIPIKENSSFGLEEAHAGSLLSLPLDHNRSCIQEAEVWSWGMGKHTENSSTRNSTREVEPGRSYIFQVSLIYRTSSRPDLAIQNNTLSPKVWRLRSRKTVVPFHNASETKCRHLRITHLTYTSRYSSVVEHLPSTPKAWIPYPTKRYMIPT